MNLIEQLGGYEEANTEYQKVKNLRDSKEVEIRDKRIAFDVGILRQDMLEYRRQHNIFEAGDWFVSDTILKPFKIVEKDEDYLKLWCKEHTAEFSGNAETITKIFRNARHATDEEIKAGKRRPELDSDTCSDIRNHISPNTVVIDHAT